MICTLLCYQDDIISTIQKVTSSLLPKGWHDFDFCDLQIYYLRLRGEILRNNIHYAYKESQNCSHQEYFLSKRNVCSHLLSVMSCFDQSTLLINISPPGRGQQVCYVSAKMFVTLKPTKTLGTADTHFSPLKPHPHFPTEILRHEIMTNLEFSPATFTRSGRPYL